VPIELALQGDDLRVPEPVWQRLLCDRQAGARWCGAGFSSDVKGGDERRRLASEYGAAEFITKPVDFDVLKTQLRDLSDAAD
jgi:hypothetical protein